MKHTPTEASAERSAYVALCELFERAMPTSAELRQLRIAGPQMSVFELAHEKLSRLFDSDLCPPAFDRVFQHPSTLEQRERILYLQLRYCPYCLRAGQHSALFQNALLKQCPVHKASLQTGCSRCGTRISTTLPSIRASPFFCAECGLSFRAATRRGHKTESLNGNYFAELRLVLALRALPASARSSRGVLQWQRAPRFLREEMPSQQLVCAAARHVDWQSVRLGTPSWTEHCITLKDAQGVNDGVELAGACAGNYIRCSAVLAPLVELQQLVKKFDIDTDMPAKKPWVYLYNHGLSSMTVASIALYRTTNAYGLLEYLIGERCQQAFLIRVFGAIPDSLEAAGAVARSEVFGLFARHLGEVAAMVYTDEVNWRHEPSPETFCPAWVLESSPAGQVMRIRELADLQRLHRLVERLGRRRLEASRVRSSYAARDFSAADAGRDERLTSKRGRRYAWVGCEHEREGSGYPDRGIVASCELPAIDQEAVNVNQYGPQAQTSLAAALTATLK